MVVFLLLSLSTKAMKFAYINLSIGMLFVVLVSTMMTLQEIQENSMEIFVRIRSVAIYNSLVIIVVVIIIINVFFYYFSLA